MVVGRRHPCSIEHHRLRRPHHDVWDFVASDVSARDDHRVCSSIAQDPAGGDHRIYVVDRRSSKQCRLADVGGDHLGVGDEQIDIGVHATFAEERVPARCDEHGVDDEIRKLSRCRSPGHRGDVRDSREHARLHGSHR